MTKPAGAIPRAGQMEPFVNRFPPMSSARPCRRNPLVRLTASARSVQCDGGINETARQLIDASGLKPVTKTVGEMIRRDSQCPLSRHRTVPVRLF